VFFITGCQELIDCIINVSPELPDKTFKTGKVGELYHDELLAGINNQPNDDDYNYYFDFSGNLPEGLIMFNNVL